MALLDLPSDHRELEKKQEGKDSRTQKNETSDDDDCSMGLMPVGTKPATESVKSESRRKKKTGAELKIVKNEALEKEADQTKNGQVAKGSHKKSAQSKPTQSADVNSKRWYNNIRALLPMIVAVGIPTFLASVYFGFIASDLYYTETRISVRSPGASQSPSFMTSAMGGIQLGSASIEADSIAEFVHSHDAVRQLSEKVDLRAVFNREEGDFLSTLSPSASFEDLIDHYRNRVEVFYDQATGIITIGAKTYRPEDSYQMLEALNDISENLVNTFNKRAEEDTLRLTRAELERAEKRMMNAHENLLNFRLSREEMDPMQRSTGIMALISELEGSYAEVAAEIQEMSGYMSPDSMQVKALKNRLAAIESQIKAEEEKLIGVSSGSDRNHAEVLNEYEILMLERELAHQEYASAMASLESARMEAQRQQVYLVPIVHPHQADTAIFPRRLENIALVFIASFLIFVIGRLVVVGIQDHLMN